MGAMSGSRSATPNRHRYRVSAHVLVVSAMQFVPQRLAFHPRVFHPSAPHHIRSVSPQRVSRQGVSPHASRPKVLRSQESISPKGVAPHSVSHHVAPERVAADRFTHGAPHLKTARPTAWHPNASRHTQSVPPRRASHPIAFALIS